MKKAIITIGVGTLIAGGALAFIIGSSNSQNPTPSLQVAALWRACGGACGEGKCGAGKCGGGRAETTTSPKVEGVTVECKVKGMTCSGCEKKVMSALLQMEGVQVKEVSHKKGVALLVVDTTVTPLPKVKEAIASAKFEAKECTIMQ